MTDPTPTPTPHRATQRQWHRVGVWGNLQADGATYDMSSTILELTARVEALEAQQHAPCPHIRSSDEGTSYCALAEQAAQQQEQPPMTPPEPDDSLVSVLARIITDVPTDAHLFEEDTRAVIRVTARWLRANGWGAAAFCLEREAER